MGYSRLAIAISIYQRLLVKKIQRLNDEIPSLLRPLTLITFTSLCDGGKDLSASIQSPITLRKNDDGVNEYNSDCSSVVGVGCLWSSVDHRSSKKIKRTDKEAVVIIIMAAEGEEVIPVWYLYRGEEGEIIPRDATHILVDKSCH